MIQYVKKLWGHEEILVNTEKYCAKFLCINSGFICSFHYHKIKDETFYVLYGAVQLTISDSPDDVASNIKMLHKGDQIRIKPNQPHSFSSLTDESKILEVSTHDDVEDSYRITKSREL